jgi:hypothetical protein
MIRPQLGDSVTVPQWSIGGQLIGVLTKFHGRTQYQVRYPDGAGRITDQWFYLEDFMHDPTDVQKHRKAKLDAAEDAVLREIVGETGALATPVKE